MQPAQPQQLVSDVVFDTVDTMLLEQHGHVRHTIVFQVPHVQM